MSSIVVFAASLRGAAQLWDDQATELYAARSTLRGADADLLGTTVAPVARDFLDRWALRLTQLHHTAEADAEALRGVWDVLLSGDLAVVQALRGLVPHGFDWDLDLPSLPGWMS